MLKHGPGAFWEESSRYSIWMPEDKSENVVEGMKMGTVCALPVLYGALNGNSLPTFRDNLLVPSSGVKQSKQSCRTSWTA